MPYSVIRNGEVEDITYRKLADNAYSVRLGEIYIGQVHKLNSGWASISDGELGVPIRMRSMGGFKNRFKATEYILVAKGIRNRSSH